MLIVKNIRTLQNPQGFFAFEFVFTDDQTCLTPWRPTMKQARYVFQDVLEAYYQAQMLDEKQSAPAILNFFDSPVYAID